VESESSGPNKKAIIGLVIIVLLVIASTGAVIASSNNSSPKTSDSVSTASISPSTSTSPSASSTATSSSASSFKDGSYTATGTYDSPGGPQSIDVKVTLAGGVITDTSVTQHPTDDEASGYQSQFVSGYKSQVVGKKITDVNLSRVAGSSLTPIGFNSALDSIKSEAAA
jgi:uncharacterized protein with FMN-binding domain